MPPIERTDLRDRAVMWGYIRSGRDGDPLVARPLEIACRWEEGNIELPDESGSRIMVDVILAAKQSIPVNSIMWEGKLLVDDTFLAPDGTTYPALGPTIFLYEVVIRWRSPDLKKRAVRYEYGLRRYKDKLPRVAS